MATRAPPPPPVNETSHSASRITREGKKITYQLHVMQQPERARACGAGAKSSADRRPVDPPPVVEMRIFESDPHDDTHRTDMTFAYNANFFLFATLETARPMAQGRLAPGPSCPVLTGVPVAGVAYLDRPSQAGYFIFPDLSVRHEGVYRLSFHLFEQTKDHKDATQGTEIPAPPIPGKLSAPQQFLEFRLEVVSVPFTVYSAKKFPGLTTSTQLSRVIAEQGCRVRIRRDVRMRRRGDKRSDDYEYEDERMYTSRHSDRSYSVNPPIRDRSTSIGTVDHAYEPYAGQPYPPVKSPAYHRQMPPAALPSSTPIPPLPAHTAAVSPTTPSPTSAPIPADPPAAHPSFHTPSYQSHLSFGAAQAQYPAPQMAHAPLPTAATPNVYSPRHSISHGRNPSLVSEYESSTNYPYPPPRLPNERPSYSKPQAVLPPLLPPTNRGLQQSAGHQSIEQSGATPSSSNPIISLPSLSSLSELPPISSHSTHSSNSIGSSPGNDYGNGKRLWDTNPTLSKRTHEETFGYDDRALHNGMRPETECSPTEKQRRPSEDRELFLDYKRANGRVVSRIHHTT